MGGSVSKLVGGLVLPLFALCACQSSKDELDLGTNEILYSSPGYHARMPADRVAFMPPVADKRVASAEEASSGAVLVQVMEEGRWRRPMVVMLDEVLRDELRSSDLFASIADSPPPPPEAVIVQVDVLQAQGSAQSYAAKRRSVGELALRVTVRGPVDASGGRDVIWTDEFHEVVQSELSIRPPTVPQMVGAATKRIVGRICAALDESNVGRSGIPISASDK